MKQLVLLISFLFYFFSAFAQQSEGYILYSMQYADLELSKEEIAIMPTTSEMWFKGDNMRMTLPMGLGLESSVIVTADQVHILLDIMGNKMAVKSSQREIQKESRKATTYRLKSLTNESKDIAGFTCKKAIMSAEGEQDMVVWFSDQIRSKGSWYYNLDGIIGVPLEFSLRTAEVNARMVAKEVKLGKVDDKIFKISEDYKLMTQEEMMKLLQH